MQTAALKTEEVPFGLKKADPEAVVFTVSGRTEISIKAGTHFSVADGSVIAFETDTRVGFLAEETAPGTDMLVFVYAHGAATAFPRGTEPEIGGGGVIGGFHYAPGGNATGTGGGDDVPAINPYSCWDIAFRPACADPSGLALVDGSHGGASVAPFWCDIYLTPANHKAGTSRLGVTIADGYDRPEDCAKFDYETARTVLALHGKQLLSAEEFFAAAYGVTERSVHNGDPKVTKLDAPRTSHYGIMQAAGNLWAWGTDGHPDIPRASLFGGSWLSGGVAGSRCANLGNWPEYSYENIGARGRSDHLTA
jgi:hypothetical protein